MRLVLGIIPNLLYQEVIKINKMEEGRIRKIIRRYFYFLIILSVFTGIGYLISGPKVDKNNYKNYVWPEDTDRIIVEQLIKQ